MRAETAVNRFLDKHVLWSAMYHAAEKRGQTSELGVCLAILEDEADCILAQYQAPCTELADLADKAAGIAWAAEIYQLVLKARKGGLQPLRPAQAQPTKEVASGEPQT